MNTHRVTTPGPLRVLSWHLVAYKRFWKANVLSGLVQPLLYMLGLGVGVGALVDRKPIQLGSPGGQFVLWREALDAVPAGGDGGEQ